MLKVSQLNKSFYHDGQSKRVLEDISFAVEPGEFFCLAGASGSGKTTLLRCIGGFENIDSGNASLNGQRLKGPGIDRIMVFQGFDQLFAWKTVEANIEYPLKVNGISKVQRQKRVEHYLSMVGLSAYGSYYPYQLSGGMKQRVAIARALALEPRLLLMDEPFGNLDALTRNNLQQELLRIKEELTATILFVTHDITEAIILGDRVMILSQRGRVKDIIENPLPKPRQPSLDGFADMWGRSSAQLGEN